MAEMLHARGLEGHRRLIHARSPAGRKHEQGVFAWSGFGPALLKNKYYAMRHGMSEANEQAPLKNKYYAMRHGLSEANEPGIVVSDPVNGIPKAYQHSIIVSDPVNGIPK
ncbi:hypothetical protein T484DRAFT_1854221 [Baffinella frigidus]|nr:hypothetical protein T484DRAFT_1854221 [Cryptophyta sp. CCMP2293]